jgi:hypothetical protein
VPLITCTMPASLLTTELGLTLPCRTLAYYTLTGALHLLRFGATLDSKSDWNVTLIDTSASLALAHLSQLQSHPDSLAQVHINQSVCAFSLTSNQAREMLAMNGCHAVCMSTAARLW